MKVTEFDYELPEELIAQHPVEPRDTSPVKWGIRHIFMILSMNWDLMMY